MSRAKTPRATASGNMRPNGRSAGGVESRATPHAKARGKPRGKPGAGRHANRHVPRSDDDAAYKLLFSSPALVRDLVQGFIPDDWLRSLDYSTLEKVPGSYVTDDLRHRADDVVWRVRTGEDWIYLYLLIEFQSTPDPWMAVRMMSYVGLLYQDLIRRGEVAPPVQEDKGEGTIGEGDGSDTQASAAPTASPARASAPGCAVAHAETVAPSEAAASAGTTPRSRRAASTETAPSSQTPASSHGPAPRAGKRLPPVLPIVLYNGSARWTAATDIAELLPKAPGLVAKYLPRMQYLLLDQGELAKRADLAQLRNLAAAVIRLEHPENVEAIVQLIDELNGWLDGQPELRRTFSIWIRAVVLRQKDRAWILPQVEDLKELRMGLAEQVERWAKAHEQRGLQAGIQQGIQQGMQQGRQEGARQAQTLILQTLLARRFGALPPQVLERILQATPEQLELWLDRVLDAESLAAVFAES